MSGNWRDHFIRLVQLFGKLTSIQWYMFFGICIWGWHFNYQIYGNRSFGSILVCLIFWYRILRGPVLLDWIHLNRYFCSISVYLMIVLFVNWPFKGSGCMFWFSLRRFSWSWLVQFPCGIRLISKDYGVRNWILDPLTPFLSSLDFRQQWRISWKWSGKH